MLLLSKKYSNYKLVGTLLYKPINIPLLNFSSINREIEKLEQQEEDIEVILEANKAIAEATLERMRLARVKLKRLRKQKKLLQRKKRKLFNSSLINTKEIKQLEALKILNQDIALANLEAPVVAYTINQSAFQDTSSNKPQLLLGISSSLC